MRRLSARSEKLFLEGGRDVGKGAHYHRHALIVSGGASQLGVHGFRTLSAAFSSPSPIFLRLSLALALPSSVVLSFPPPSLSHAHPLSFSLLLSLSLSLSPSPLSLSFPLPLSLSLSSSSFLVSLTFRALRFARGFKKRCTYAGSRLIAAFCFARGFKKSTSYLWHFDFFVQKNPILKIQVGYFFHLKITLKKCRNMVNNLFIN